MEQKAFNIYMNPKIIKTIFFGISFLFAYFLFPSYYESNIFPLQPSDQSWTSLDPSWFINLNYVKSLNLTWGEDVVFTYGPLAQLVTKVGWNENKYLFLFFDLFLFLNWFFILFISLKNSKNYFLTVTIAIIILLILPSWTGVATSIVLLFFFQFWIRQVFETNDVISYLFLISNSVLIFFIKLNTGLISLPIFFTLIIYKFFKKEINYKYFFFYFTTPIIIILILCNFLNVSLSNYIINSLEIIKGYNGIMYLDNQIKGSIGKIIILISLFIISIIFALHDKKLRKIEKFGYAMMYLLFFFILYKQAFVRADIGHINEFFVYFPLLIFTIPDFQNCTKINYVIILILCMLFVDIKFLNDNKINVIDFNNKLNKKEYVNGFLNKTNTSGLFISEGYSKLPEEFIRKIGNHSVDVFPWNIQMLIENNLNYYPRPVFQSYTTYTDKLQELNFNFYNSENAPEYVIFEYQSIDNRYPLFDESLVYIVLKENYSIESVGIIDNREILLLKKNSIQKKIEFEKIDEYAILLGSDLIPKEDVLYKIETYKNILGTVFSTFKHGLDIELVIQLKKGGNFSYKTSDNLLKAGVFSKVHIKDIKDFKNYFSEPDKVEEISHYQLKSKEGNFLKDKLRITEYKIIKR